MRLAACGTVLALACGYSFSHGGRLPAGAAALGVAAPLNRTAQAEAGGLFAAALREELSARGQLGDGPSAELEIVALRSSPSALAGAGAFAFRLDAEVRLRIRDAAGGALYEDGAVLGDDYLAGVDVLGTEANRRAALRRLCTAIARELVRRMTAAGRL